MPRYHFNVEDGYSLPDEDGTDLRDLDNAKDEAVRLAGEILKNGGRHFWKTQTEWRMTVTDAGGQPVFTLRFAAEEHPE